MNKYLLKQFYRINNIIHLLKSNKYAAIFLSGCIAFQAIKNFCIRYIFHIVQLV